MNGLLKNFNDMVMVFNRYDWQHFLYNFYVLMFTYPMIQKLSAMIFCGERKDI